ncbi:cell division protein FtsL [Candidatus Arthromitus sp. SFB-mouse-Japan]|uniref:FtsB family cell division protein n=1 Tax=unclassified Candidatus Neoarthromitus TaxID=2638829 RepID=UPI00021B817B|nr:MULTISPECIES: septum formation initiator family protein [unclassified Candidatus Arthromitus]EIA22190.1 Septum formation initiator superfamily [Candidatus Arthromitus sp. SFB-1]EIA27103.1 Septum formation initiator superfamily [Candidatus Arthromitus sp. SFB-4]EIA29468.1 Septum formation initiator superfamily [Candidatus Arthromitus sp. SFB-co]EIA29689.1 Septum formation initiator superfamily [Candidatus Arthromitus sp. SFB-mouse-SU]EIA31754.1 Septum formation initiator superfamily [Candida
MVKQRKRIFFIRNIVILVILIYSLITLFKNDFDRYNVEVEFMKYQDKLEDITWEIQLLKDELNLSNTKEYLEVLVRDRLGYVFEGEKSIINIVK